MRLMHYEARHTIEYSSLGACDVLTGTQSALRMMTVVMRRFFMAITHRSHHVCSMYGLKPTALYKGHLGVAHV